MSSASLPQNDLPEFFPISSSGKGKHLQEEMRRYGCVARVENLYDHLRKGEKYGQMKKRKVMHGNAFFVTTVSNILLPEYNVAIRETSLLPDLLDTLLGVCKDT